MNIDIAITIVLVAAVYSAGVAVGAWLTHRRETHRPPLPFTVDVPDDADDEPAGDQIKSPYRGL